MPAFTAKTTIGDPFIELTEVASTNIYAMEQIQSNLAGHGSAYFAYSQTMGRGQQGKKWLSEPGSNLILSVIIDSSCFSITQLFQLSLVVSIAAHDFFSRYGGEETSIKWPNDIYWRDRKAGGILIENVIRGDKWLWAVVGIGVNLNQTVFPEALSNPVSLKQITGKTYDCVTMAKAFCACFEERFQGWKQGNFFNLLSFYNQLLYKKGQRVLLKKKNILFHGTIEAVTAAGELVVNNGMKQVFKFGEIDWVMEK